MILNESYIYLDDLRFHAFHGVMPQERLTGNDYTIDIKIGYDVSLAMVSDNVDDTLNYAEVYKIVDQEMGVPSQFAKSKSILQCKVFFFRYCTTCSIISATMTSIDYESERLVSSIYYYCKYQQQDGTE